MKNVLVVNSYHDKNSFLIDFIQELKDNSFEFILFSSPSKLIESFSENNWRYKKIYLGPDFGKKFSFIKYIFLFLPFLFIHFFIFLFHKYKFGIGTLVCLNWNEKLVYTPLANMLGVKVIWLERPGINYRKYSKFLIKKYKKASKRVKVISFVGKNKIQLKSLGFNEENIKVIYPGIKFKKEARHQDSIFNELARKDKRSFKSKYFTLGVITDYNHPNQIENLFHAVKICQTVIPNIQLIIVGDGEYKKQMAWTAKKMEIDNLTWFVGWQANLKKWFDSFDLYIASAEIVKLIDIKLLLKAMTYSLPIIGFKDLGYENFIYEGETGLMSEAGDSEALAQNILKLYNNKLLITKYGQQGRELAEERFDIKKQAKKFEKIL